MTERKIKAYRGCSTFGLYPFGEYCNNEKCSECNEHMLEFSKLFKEEVEKQINKYKRKK